MTAQYMDVETRLENLKNQRTRLQQLQQQADNLSDLLEIESSLTDVQSQIESWQSQMDWYNNQVEECTVYVSLSEVSTYSPPSEGFGDRFVSALSAGWQNFCGWPAAGHRYPCRCMAGGGDRSRRLRRVRGLEKEEKINQKILDIRPPLWYYT